MCGILEGEVVNNACVGGVRIVCGRVYTCMVISMWRYRS